MISYRQKMLARKYTAIKPVKINNFFSAVKAQNICKNRIIEAEKSKKIDKLVSNIYIYKFPPVLNWPDGVNIDIPVDFIIAIRKIFEHISYLTVDNIDELCFAFGAEFSSYGDKILIIPVEYVLHPDLRNQFIDVFAHETAHALAFAIFKDKFLLKKFKTFHGKIKSGSVKNRSIFFEPQNSTERLSLYQHEDYIEFFAELASQILIHYKELIKYISSLKHTIVRQAYFDAVSFLLYFTVPLSQLLVNQLAQGINSIKS